MRVIWLIFGFITLILAILGVILPLLPTVPFLLLAAACYLKSSEKFYNWLLNHKLLGKFITNYLKYKAISIRSKVVSIILLWLTIGYSILFVISHFYIKIILLIVAIGVSIHLLLLKTLK